MSVTKPGANQRRNDEPDYQRQGGNGKKLGTLADGVPGRTERPDAIEIVI